MRLFKIAIFLLAYSFLIVSFAGLPDSVVAKYTALNLEKVGSDLAKMRGGAQKFPHIEEATKYAKSRQGFSINAELLKDPSFLKQFIENLSDELQVTWRKEALDLIEAGKKAKAAGKALPEGITGWQKEIINGSAMERMKAFKVDGQQFTVANQKELEKVLKEQNIPKEFWKNYRINPKNNIEVDILSETPNRFLGDHKFDNFKSAEAVGTLLTYYLRNGGATDIDSLARFIHKASDIVHQKWMSRNHGYAPDDQLKNFGELSRPEASKDIVLMDTGFDVAEKMQLSFLNERVAALDSQILKLKKDPNGQRAIFSVQQERARYSNQLEALKAKARFQKIQPPEAGSSGTR